MFLKRMTTRAGITHNGDRQALHPQLETWYAVLLLCREEDAAWGTCKAKHQSPIRSLISSRTLWCVSWTLCRAVLLAVSWLLRFTGLRCAGSSARRVSVSRMWQYLSNDWIIVSHCSFHVERNLRTFPRQWFQLLVTLYSWESFSGTISYWLAKFVERPGLSPFEKHGRKPWAVRVPCGWLFAIHSYRHLQVLNIAWY